MCRRYAADRGIVVVPEFDMPGAAVGILVDGLQFDMPGAAVGILVDGLQMQCVGVYKDRCWWQGMRHRGEADTRI